MDLLEKLGKNRIAIIAGSALISFAGIVFIVFQLSKPTMGVLYSDLSQEDASLVISKLQIMGKHFSSDGNGKTIMVPVKDILPLRMELAQEGIPNSSNIIGYEVFDKNDMFGSSQFTNKVNEIRALEGELTRTINSLSEIEQSRVHIVLPKSDYFSRTGPEPSASIFLKVKNGKKLNESQVNGIANLVASAVPSLSVEKISIVDQNGKALKTPGEEDQASNAKNITDYKINLELRLKRAVEGIVEKYVGLDRVQANVVADIDFDKIVVNQEVFDPDSQVARSQKNSSESSTDTEMDKNISVSTNLPNFLQKPQASSVKEQRRSDEIINYEISKTITNKVIQWGAIKQLSVAVLVDGVYERDKNTKKDVYVRDRTPEELDKIRQLVSAAVGIDESRGDRIEVMNLQFAPVTVFESDTEESGIKYDPATIVQIVLILGVIGTSALLFFRPKIANFFKKDDIKINDMPFRERNFERNTEDTKVEEENKKASDEKKPFSQKQYAELLQYLHDSASSNIDETVQVLRKWIETKN